MTEMLNITPDPKILVALTRTPLAPLDALCELIDNGVDSFGDAKLGGEPVRGPLVQVTLPGGTEVNRGEGIVRVVDNGPGLSRQGIGDALRAGWTSKNPFDTLGLFGMGFNIATGKIGQTTTLTTARRDDEFALRTVLDIPELLRSHEFFVPMDEVAKPPGLSHGTMIEVTNWWPEGDPNSGFVRRLADIPKKTVREQLGRRYATLLGAAGPDAVRMLVNEDPITPFEHCVWAEERFVERGKSRYPAKVMFNDVIHTQRRCAVDATVLSDGESTCPECGGQEFRTVDERIRGWIGVQRFDDNDRYGIDLIRNGRAIRVLEKQAFFVFTDETTKEDIREYPVDQQTGRIVGEVHLDHVPVDFQKQDFQRTSDEWVRAMEYLRGGSLLPSKWGDTPNATPVSRIFQGYRKVRNYGRADMYMGVYNPAKKAAERVPRSVEQEYYERFLNHEAGYYDDAKWWELVESAGIPPVQELPECSECGFQNQPDAEVCADCGKVLRGRPCVSCGEEIPISAVQCEHCGASQVADVEEPWVCNVCGTTNSVDDETCTQCSSVRGADNPVSRDVLLKTSARVDDLSFDSQSFNLADGSTYALEADVYASEAPLRPVWDGQMVPVLSFKSAGDISIVIDRNHPALTDLAIREEMFVAVEVAQYLYELNRHLIGKGAHSVNTLALEVLDQVWGDKLVESAATVRESVHQLFRQISDRLHGNPDAEDFYLELDDDQQRRLADALIAAGQPLDQLASLRTTADYLRFVDPSTIVDFFKRSPDSWFGSVWADTIPDSSEVGPGVAERGREELVTKYLRCLEDVAAYVRYQYPEPLIIARSRASRDFLESKLA